MISKEFMQQAIEQMKKSMDKVKVGAVLVLKGGEVFLGAKDKGIHGERVAIQAAEDSGLSIAGATLYTTLEPCTNLREGQKLKSCAELIVEKKISTVVIGRYDPNPNVYRKGWKYLRDNGVNLYDFCNELRLEVDSLNEKFMGYFTEGRGPKGGAKVDHRDDGTFRVFLSEDDERFIDIKWTNCGVDAAYGYAIRPVQVALARYAEEFIEVDDPLAYEYSHSAKIKVGEIGIFNSPLGAVLVKPKEIESGPDYGAENYFVNFEFEVRPASSSC